jgi:hypothetical protein
MSVGLYAKNEVWFKFSVIPEIMNQITVILTNTLNEILLESVSNFLHWLFFLRPETIVLFLDIGIGSTILELLEQYTNENSPIKYSKNSVFC